MKTFLLVDSFYPINSRNIKIAQSLQNEYKDCILNIIAWNRENKNIKKEHNNYYTYEKYSPAGKLFKKLVNLLGFGKFVKKINNKLNPQYLIASHWEVLLILAIIKKNNQVLIYENLDIPTANNRFVLAILQRIEKCALKKTDVIIFASRFFYPLYNSFKGEKIILENKPTNSIQSNNITLNKSDDFIVSYIGNVRYFPIMKNLVDSIGNLTHVKLFIHGDGACLEDLKKYSSRYTNIVFTGRYEVDQLPELYNACNVVWAVYPNDDYNVKFAISNKFHESLIYKKPCIYASQTMLGKYVQDNKLGWIVDPYNVDEIRNLIIRLSNNITLFPEIEKHLSAEANKSKTWNEDFKRLVNFINIQ